MAQQARPKVTGQMEERRAHCTILVTVVVKTGISNSAISFRISPLASRLASRSSLFVTPVEHALAPDVDVAGEQDQEEHDQLEEAHPAQLADGEGPWIKERDFDVEQEKDHRHQIE